MLKHTLFTWLFTCVMGTLILCLYFGFAEGGFKKNSEMEVVAAIALVLTLLASLPAMLAYHLMAGSLISSMTPQRAKGLLSGYALLSTALSCVMLLAIIGHGGLDSEGAGLLLLALPYGLSFALAVWIIPMPLPQPVTIADGPEPEAADLPVAPPPAHYIVAGIAGLMLLYTLGTLITGAMGMSGGYAPLSMLLYLLDIGLMAAALVLFLRRKRAGWRLMVLLATAGIAGTVLSLLSSFRMLSGHIGMMFSYFAMIALFALLDGIMLYLLQQPVLRKQFGSVMRDYGIWVLAGVGWAVVRMVAVRIAI